MKVKDIKAKTLYIGEREIKIVCAMCAVKYGIDKKWKQAPYTPGYCDICEATGNPGVHQSVTEIKNLKGVDGDIFNLAKGKKHKAIFNKANKIKKKK